MTAVRRRLPLLVLLILGIVGFVLVMTGGEDGPGMESITTEEGLRTEVPAGWTRTEQFAFQFAPPGDEMVTFDRWTVARACGPNGCAVRSLSEWLKEAMGLPSFVNALEPDSDLEIIEDRTDTRSRVLVARSRAGATLVLVAAFTDGADFYIECGVSLGLDGDQRLADQIVDTCLSTH